MPQSYTQSGRRLGFAVLSFVLCTILMVTLEPLEFRIPRHVDLTWWDGPFDVVANIALFVIPGFLYAWSSQKEGTLQRAFVYGAISSTLIEIIQTFEPARFPSPTDVFSNTTGAWLGAWIFLRVARHLRSDTSLIGMLALDMPLMGLTYLAVPLCMLAALTQPRAVHDIRAYDLLALACFMGVLLGHVQRFRFGPRRLVRPSSSALAAGASFAIGALPALRSHAAMVTLGMALASGVAWCVGALFISSAHSTNRRFEGSALRRAAPFFAAYLVLSAITSKGIGARVSTKQVLTQVESYAAFTVFGFLLAEGWGRLELRYRWVAAYVAVICLVAALGLHELDRTSIPTVWTILGIAARAIAGAYGGWIYHLQRAHVRLLVAAQRGETSVVVDHPAERSSIAA